MNNRGLSDLIISLFTGIKPVDKIKLINAIDNEEELYLKTQSDFEDILGHPIIYNWDINEYRNKADRIDTICKMRSIKWVSYADAEYPPLLREIFDPPGVLYYKGELANPEKPLLGIVGTRRPSPEASSQAFKLSYGVGLAGISVISGLALGIDTMAHRGNLTSNVPGYAVLGSGLDEIYPATNRSLAKKILESGGALISEYHPGTHPAKWNFPARNRIISGLSRGVVIVEAPKKSGALITASFALEHGKELWVASSGVENEPGYSSSFDKRGTRELVLDGAEIIFDSYDILEKWNMNFYVSKIDASGEEVAAGRELAASMANYLEIEL